MTLERNDSPIEILMVEDNEGDVRLTQEILGGIGFSLNFTVAADGEVAMACLRKEGEHGDSPRPDLIILDLNMPKKNGWEVLEDMKGDPDLSSIPVVILTSTTAEQGLLHDYGIHPSRYCQKPINANRFTNVITQLRSGASVTPTLPGTQAAQPEERPEQRKRSWWPFGR